ncbi:hypothetical protein SH2C18_22620 [Clostridium sediminicola]|uniref:hypothetical protein n=1 Tax=Clostridium sediminicola TaxID=3114879 RepID=UPI0031F20EE8
MKMNKSTKESNGKKTLVEKKVLSDSDRNYYEYIRNFKNNKEELNECGNDYSAAFMML